jgi:hypothetical protein
VLTDHTPEPCVLRAPRTGATHAARLRFLNWLASHLLEQSIRERRVWRAPERECRRYLHFRAFRPLRRADHAVDPANGLFVRYGGWQ